MILALSGFLLLLSHEIKVEKPAGGWIFHGLCRGRDLACGHVVCGAQATGVGFAGTVGVVHPLDCARVCGADWA